jgi:hypothetical protein
MRQDSVSELVGRRVIGNVVTITTPHIYVHEPVVGND